MRSRQCFSQKIFDGRDPGALEGSAGTILVPSGLAAVTIPFLGFVAAGDHALVVDSVYGPTRHFCDTILKRIGVEVEYYDPAIGARIETLFRPNTNTRAESVSATPVAYRGNWSLMRARV